MEAISKVSTANDYVIIEVLSTENITLEKEYEGVSVKLAGHIKQVRVPFSIDIGVGDVVVPKALKRSIKTRFSDFDQPEDLYLFAGEYHCRKIRCHPKTDGRYKSYERFLTFTICPVCLTLMDASYRKPFGKQYSTEERRMKQTVLTV